MKIRNVVIFILLLIICGQFIQSFFLLNKFDRLSFTFVRRPVEVYVAGLTESVRMSGPLKSEIIFQHKWLSERLCKCIERLEQQEGLEPLPMEFPSQYPMLGQYSQIGGPNHPLRPPLTDMAESIPYYECYEEPNYPPFEDDEESDIQKLRAVINLQIIGIRMYLEPSRIRIENYEKRLKRLEEHWNK